jgi:excisionase family DNA binding protein
LPIDVRAFRVQEVVERYRIGKTKLYALMKSGDLRTVKVGRTRLIPIEAIEALLADGARTPQGQRQQRQPPLSHMMDHGVKAS